MKARCTLVFIVLCVFAFGCGGSSSGGGSSGQQSTQSINVAGTWQITAKSSVFSITSLVSGVITQFGTNLSGQLTISGSPCATSAPMSGTLSGTGLSIQLNESGQTVTLSGTASGDGSSAGGTYNAPAGGCTNGDSGTWTGIRLPQISTVIVNPTSVTGGTSSSGTVTLSGVAPTGGAIVTLSSNNTSAATLPTSVMIGAGLTTATFAVATHAVSTAIPVTITGTYNGTQTTTLTVNSPVLSSVSLNPTSVLAGVSSVGTVTLSGAAPTGGAVVALSSSNSTVAAVPQSVTVPTGSLMTTFQVTTASSATTTVVTITAQFGGAQMATITVNAISAPSADLTGNWQASFTSSISPFINSGALMGISASLEIPPRLTSTFRGHHIYHAIATRAWQARSRVRQSN